MSKDEKPRKATKTGRAILLGVIMKENSVELFLDQRGEVYTYVQCGDHFEVISLRGGFGNWLRNKLWQKHQATINDNELKEFVSRFEAEARYGQNKKTIELHNRVAYHDGAVYVDLCDPKWCVVKVTKEGWSIESKYPVRFKRFPHQKPQVIPVQAPAEALKKLWECLPNLSNEDTRILLEVFAVTAAIPGFPHPVLEILGQHGSGKSTLERALKSLVDPSANAGSKLNRDVDELALALYKNYMPIFDNVSAITQDQSDALCRASTGDAYSKRKLYTDEGSVIEEYRRVVMLNGITMQLNRADLQDRAILLELEPISDSDREEERVLEERFEELKPILVGALYSAVSKTLALYPQVEVAKKPRMADFTRYGEAAARALGYPEGRFLESYLRNRALASGIVLAQNPVGTCILSLMKDRKEWTGTATELLDELRDISGSCDVNPKVLPRGPSPLSGVLTRLEPNLRAEGLEISRHHSGITLFTIRWIAYLDDVDDTSSSVSIPDNRKGVEEKDMTAVHTVQTSNLPSRGSQR